MSAWVRHHGALFLLLASALSGLVWPIPFSWPTRLILGWDLGVVLYLALSFGKAVQTNGLDDIRRRAADLDQGGSIVLPLALIAAMASVGVVLMRTDWISHSGMAAGIGQATAALSWLFVHVLFAFHYAHRFYAPGGSGRDRQGLIFPGTPEPDYWDFLHFALIIGVASQTADIQIADRSLRRLSTVHSLVAFAFNTVILALTINLAVSALSG